MKISTLSFKTLLNSFNIKILSVLFFLFACNHAGDDNAVSKKEKPPNILFISIDDLNPTLGVYGNKHIKTPNIDKLAEDGTTFMRAYCQAAVSAPSRASLMTGLRPDSTKVWHLGDKFREIDPNTLTMPQYFHKFGYYTVNIGKIFHNYMPDSISWDEPDLRPGRYARPEWAGRDGETYYVNEETRRKQKIKRDSIMAHHEKYYADGWNNGPAWEAEDVPDTMYYDGAQTELAIKTLTRLAKMDKPFYFGLGYFRPHLPFVASKKYWDMYDPDSIPMAPNPFVGKDAPIMALNSMYELRGYDGFSYLVHPTVSEISDDTSRILKHGYYACVSFIDAQIGRLVEHLKKLGIYDNTIIVLWGDHGWKLGEHNSWGKMTNYHIDTHVPLIVCSPFSKNKGNKTYGLTELVDIFPSLCELAGIDIPEYMQGSSFAPLMDDPGRQWKEAAFSQFHRRPKVSPDRKRYMGYSVQTKDFHYIEWYYWDNKKKLRGNYVTNELYDNINDPNENINIAGRESSKDLVTNMSKLLKNGWRSVKPKR